MLQSARQSHFRAAFTLIELLIVLAIIAVLAALLFPVLRAAREQARRTVCASNLHQIGLALTMYRQDCDELPPRLSLLTPNYISHPGLLLCPNDPKHGQYNGTLRMEGANFLAGGVSYDYEPNWAKAQELGWWEPAPNYGNGKWNDLTPIADCQWHWAKKFHPDWTQDVKTPNGWQLILTLSGSVRKIRVEDPIEDFTPDRYH